MTRFPIPSSARPCGVTRKMTGIPARKGPAESSCHDDGPTGLGSQINVAAAGIDHPGVVIIGCAKVSNGPPWPPFAARLNERHMRYEVLSNFDLDEWAEGMGNGSPGRRKKLVTAEDVAGVVEREGGEIVGGKNSPHGLVQQVMKEFKVGRPASEEAVRMALGQTIQYVDHPAPNGRQGKRVYVLKKP